MKAAVAEQGEYDAVRFDSSKHNWSLKELDVSVHSIDRIVRDTVLLSLLVFLRVATSVVTVWCSTATRPALLRLLLPSWVLSRPEFRL